MIKINNKIKHLSPLTLETKKDSKTEKHLTGLNNIGVGD
jgi:hypothetical protein